MRAKDPLAASMRSQGMGALVVGSPKEISFHPAGDACSLQSQECTQLPVCDVDSENPVVFHIKQVVEGYNPRKPVHCSIGTGDQVAR